MDSCSWAIPKAWGGFGYLFATLDRKAKLYQRKQEVTGSNLIGSFLPLKLPTGTPLLPVEQIKDLVKVPLRELTERVLLEHFAAVAALVSGQGDILYLHGRTGRYLELAPGAADMNILKMAREELRPALTNALHKALTQHGPASLPGLRINAYGTSTVVNLTVRPTLASHETLPGVRLFLVILEEVPAPSLGPSASGQEPETESDPRIIALRQELRTAEEYLVSSTEELETANEELKSTNEELQSLNEELQSTNEELETSKEELQSVNEELSTVNNELQTKMTDLARANNDLSNLLASTEIGTIFVDHQLRIQRFTPAVTQVINLIPNDVGRPVGHIVSNLVGYDRLVDDVKAVLDQLTSKEIEVQTQQGAWFLLRIRPYRTVENVIEGAVITFVDITALKRAQALVRESQSLRQLAAVVSDARDAILVMNLAGRILAWNPAAARLYGWTEAEAITKNISEMIPEGQREEAIATLRQWGKAEVPTPHPMERIAKAGRIVPIWLSITALLNESGEVYAIATTERERKAE